jgi:hypothetical protein
LAVDYIASFLGRLTREEAQQHYERYIGPYFTSDGRVDLDVAQHAVDAVATELGIPPATVAAATVRGRSEFRINPNMKSRGEILGSTKPGERRGGRQLGTPNKKTVLRNAAICAAALEVRTLRANDKHTYVAFARLMHCDPQSLRKAQIEAVKGRVGQHDTSDRAIAFESDRHLRLLRCANRLTRP